MGRTTSTTVTCDCCGYSFSDGVPGEIYTTMSIPGSSDTTTKIYCYTKGCNLHVPSAISNTAGSQASAHVAAKITVAVAAPTLPSATAVAAPAGGAFAAGTFFWKITAVNAAGETVGSAEVTATPALNGGVDLAWTASTGATGYRVYRSLATGTYNDPAFVAAVSGQATATYRDLGLAINAGGLPTANTTTGLPVRTTPY